MSHPYDPVEPSPPPIVYATPLPRRPFIVRLGLYGVPGRRWAWAYFWGCTSVALLSLVLAFAHHPAWIVGTSMLLSAGWYFAAIRWVDRHGQW